MSNDQHFKDKIEARNSLTSKGYVRLPRQNGKTHYLPIDIEYWKNGTITAGIREVRPQKNGNKWLVFYRDPNTAGGANEGIHFKAGV